MAEVAKHNGSLAYLSYAGNDLGNRLSLNIDTTVREIESSDADTTLVDEALVGRANIRITGSFNLDLTDTAQAAVFTQVIGLGTTAGTAQSAATAIVFGYSAATGSTLWTCQGFITKLSTSSPDETTATVNIDIRIISIPTPSQAA